MRETDSRTAQDLKQLRQLHSVQKGRCFYCPRRIAFTVPSLDPRKVTVDHFFPLCRGGRDNISNMVLACQECNSRKGDNFPTLEDILRWNQMSTVWPHIHPLTLDRHVPNKKRCVVCNAFIPWERLLESMQSKGVTHTCSRACSNLNQAAKRRQRRFVKRLEAGEAGK